MAEPSDILVVGGCGVVGRRIAAQLASVFPGRVVVEEVPAKLEVARRQRLEAI